MNTALPGCLTACPHRSTAREDALWWSDATVKDLRRLLHALRCVAESRQIRSVREWTTYARYDLRQAENAWSDVERCIQRMQREE